MFVRICSFSTLSNLFMISLQKLVLSSLSLVLESQETGSFHSPSTKNKAQRTKIVFPKDLVYSASSSRARLPRASELSQRDCLPTKLQGRVSLEIPEVSCNAGNQASPQKMTRLAPRSHFPTRRVSVVPLRLPKRSRLVPRPTERNLRLRLRR